MSATPEEGFRPASAYEPYLRPATYRTADPNVEEKRFGYAGDVSDVRVGLTGRPAGASRWWSTGGTGPLVAPRRRFWMDLSLQSTSTPSGS